MCYYIFFDQNFMCSCLATSDHHIIAYLLFKIYSGEDDLGRGGNAESLITGNVGTRIACCIIKEVADSAPWSQYFGFDFEK